MPSILTVTLSPCIDKSTSVERLIPEKKLKCDSPALEPGGGGINVARAIVQLGGKATALYPSGGYTGKFFNQLMTHENVPSIIIDIQDETRENIIVLETSTNNQFRFGMPGAALKEQEWQKMLHVIEQAKGIEFLVASGSLPPSVPTDIFARMAVIARRRKIKLIVDTAGEALKQAVREGVYLLKPNLSELCSLVNHQVLEPHEVIGAARSVINKENCEIIVVSMGAGGAMLVAKDIERLISPPAVTIKSTVGVGDSMVGGIIYALSQHKTLETAVQYGVACGTAATMNAGTALCRKQDADRLFQQVSVSPIMPYRKDILN